MAAYADLNAAVEQYHTNEPLPEKVQSETETNIPDTTSETIPETTVPESSTPEQKATVQEEIPVSADVPQETSAPVQETSPETTVNISVQTETTV